MEKEDKQHLTSVKVDKEIFEEFRVRTIRTKFSSQKLVERAMYLYVIDDTFKDLIHNTVIDMTKISKKTQ